LMKNVTTSRRAADEQGCVATQSQVAKPVPVGLEVARPEDSAVADPGANWLVAASLRAKEQAQIKPSLDRNCGPLQPNCFAET
jgi:hypothetical protein